FAATVGFGPVRMVRVREDALKQPPLLPIKLERHEQPYSPDTPPEASDPLADAQRGLPPDRPALMQMHDRSTSDLFNRSRMGWVRERQQVAGFQSHAFTQIPSPGDPHDCADGQAPKIEQWQLARLDLIGVLSHDQPVAYDTDELPKMDELGSAPTRPLNAFE